MKLQPGRVVEVPERQLLRTSVLVQVLLYTRTCLVAVVLPCRTVCHPNSSSNDIECVVVRSRDSTYSIQGSDSAKSADSSTVSLCERSWALVITTFHSSQ